MPERRKGERRQTDQEIPSGTEKRESQRRKGERRIINLGLPADLLSQLGVLHSLLVNDDHHVPLNIADVSSETSEPIKSMSTRQRIEAEAKKLHEATGSRKVV